MKRDASRALPLLAALALAAMFVMSGAAHAQRNLGIAPGAADEARVALVIGNSAYKESPLRNPVNDAEDMARALRGAGFKVILKRNATTREMRQAIREFGAELRRAQAGLFYFAGHGIQVKGVNYLVPVGADIQGEADAEDLAIDANYALRTMEEAQVKVSIVILDACRNNPFARSFRSASQGLAQMNAATGSLVAFATAPGSVAADGTGRNGIYTRHLLVNLSAGDPDILKVFQRTRAGVVKETGGKQTPWESTSLIGDFYFSRPDSQPIAAPAAAPPAPSIEPVSPPSALAPDEPLAPVTKPVPDMTIELTFWQSAERSNAAADYAAYLNRFPEGQFVELARNRMGRLSENVQVATAAPSVAQIKRDPVNAPALPKEGDFWRYRGSNQHGADNPTYRVSKVVAGTIELRYDTNNKEQMVLVLNSDWNPLSEHGQQFVGDLKFVPFVEQYQFPLVPGKKWRSQHKGECGILCSFKVDSESEVRGWERITVPAGTFDALRIDSRNTWTNLGFTYAATGSIWLAPEVKHPVKFEFIWDKTRLKDYELESYQIAK